MNRWKKPRAPVPAPESRLEHLSTTANQTLTSISSLVPADRLDEAKTAFKALNGEDTPKGLSPYAHDSFHKMLKILGKVHHQTKQPDMVTLTLEIRV